MYVILGSTFTQEINMKEKLRAKDSYQQRLWGVCDKF